MNVHQNRPLVFLDRALEPLRPWLDDDRIVEICANVPGVVWVEVFGEAAMQRHDVPEWRRQVNPAWVLARVKAGL